MKSILLAVGLILSTTPSLAQLAPDRVSLAYFGEHGIHPGLSIGAEWLIADAKITKTKRSLFIGKQRNPKTFLRELTGEAGINAYHFPNNHIGLMLTATLGARQIKLKNGRFWGINAGIGGLQRIYTLDVFGLDENGTLVEISRIGPMQFTPLASLSVGRDMSEAWELPLSWYLKPTAWLGIPYVHTVAPSVALEMGLSLSL